MAAWLRGSILAVTKTPVSAYTSKQSAFSDGNIMSSLAATEQDTAASSKVIQPAWVRVTHWINAAAMILMVMSGWQIYNASPLFHSLTFSKSITLGGWLAGALLWHFAAMWLLMVNGLAYLITGFATGRFKNKLFPISLRGVISDAA